MALSRITLGSLALLAAACAEPPSKVESIDFKTLSGGVIGATSMDPKCPLTVRVQATISATKLVGVLRYRWEQGDVNGPEEHWKAPASAATQVIDVPVKPADWKITEAGKQLTISSRLHILSPIDLRSQPMDVDVKCN